jgi:CelD/BcsL family acetyltransferase involved in cellulose biosynthesis
MFYFRSSGFDEKYKNYSPGIVLLKHVLEDIYKNENNIKEIDWGIGDKIFQKHLGNYSFKVGSIYIFPPTFYGFILNCTKSLIVFTKTFVKAILIKFGLRDKISSYWRQRLIKKQFNKYGIKV